MENFDKYPEYCRVLTEEIGMWRTRYLSQKNIPIDSPTGCAFLYLPLLILSDDENFDPKMEMIVQTPEKALKVAEALKLEDKSP